MISRTVIVASFLAACGTMSAIHAADDPNKARAPAAGVKGTGPETLDEGTQVGAPGNIVTAAEGTVMAGHDMDKDGLITKEEAKKNSDLHSAFAKLDTNADGKLDAQEFSKFEPNQSAVSTSAPIRDGTVEGGKKTPDEEN